MMTRNMKRRILGGAATLALALAMPAAFAQGTDTTTASTPPLKATSGHHFRIGPEVGLFLPTSSKTSNRFGSSWLSLGIGLGQVDQVTEKGQTTFDLNILYQSKNGNSALVAPVGVAYRVALGKSGINTPYAGVSADLVLADLKSKQDNVNHGLQTAAGGSAFIGIDFGTTGFLEARYLGITSMKGFDLSGLNLSAGYRF